LGPYDNSGSGSNTTVVVFPQAIPQAANVTGSVTGPVARPVSGISRNSQFHPPRAERDRFRS
jgi:hypothetical protein